MYNMRVKRLEKIYAKLYLQATVRFKMRRRAGKQNAIAYAAKDAHGGIAVTRPPWIEAFWTRATINKHTPPKAKASNVYLAMGQYLKMTTYPMNNSQLIVCHSFGLKQEIHEVHDRPNPEDTSS